MCMRRIVGYILSVLSAGILIAVPAAASRQPETVRQPNGSPYPSGQVGTDVSFPNCSATNPNSPYGIVGVNGGRPYEPNPCLAKQAGWYPQHLSLYVNTA